MRKAFGPTRVLSNWSALHAYSSDASPYAITPACVVLPESVEHVAETIRIAGGENVPVHPRGGGSGLAGGAVGTGIIVDFSRMNRTLRVDVGGRTVDVEAGVVYDQLSSRIGKIGLMFAPDPSSGDTCEIGGMLANNSSGARSVKYGTTADHIESLDIVLADGSRHEVRDVSVGSPEFDRLLGYSPFRSIYELMRSNSEVVKASFPRLKKNSSGYNLLSVVEGLEGGVFSLPRLLVGSEGTLGIFVGAKLRLVPRPSSKITIQILFRSLEDVGDAVVKLLPTGPSALELVDGSSLDLVGRQKFDLPADAEAMLIVEFDDPPFTDKIEAVRLAVSSFGLSCDIKTESNPSRQEALWKARKAIVPTLYRHPGRAKPFGFIEDVEVPTESVPVLIRFVSKLFKELNLTAGVYGHIGDGNVHLRPVVDLSSAEGLDLARRLYDLVYDKVIALGGSITAEHGDGRLRAQMVERLYGPEIYRIFLQIRGMLNPDLRFNPQVKLSKSVFSENFDGEKLIRQCASCGKCNNYCPAYEVHSTEEMSARGWVRIMLTSEYDQKSVSHLLDGCLNCKNCYMVCPAGVDVSRYVTQRRSENRSRIAARIFSIQADSARFDRFARMAGKATGFAGNSALRAVADFSSRPLVHLDRHRILPGFAPQSLPERYPDLVEKTDAEVGYFYGCADRYLDLGSGPAAISLLKKAGMTVSLPTQRCCGMPQQTYGFFEIERKFARTNIDSLLRHKYVVTTCATCLGELLSYPRLFEDDSEYRRRAEQFASRCYDLAEFIWKHTQLKPIADAVVRRVAFHQPCHLRESKGSRVELTHKLIGSLPKVSLVDLPDADRCCGAAGTYNVFQYENSMKIFARKKRGFEASGAELIVSSCPTCVLQFIDGLKAHERVMHVAELADRLLC